MHKIDWKDLAASRCNRPEPPMVANSVHLAQVLADQAYPSLGQLEFMCVPASMSTQSKSVEVASGFPVSLGLVSICDRSWKTERLREDAVGRRAKRRVEEASDAETFAELARLRPYLELAREISEEVSRAAADDSLDLASVEEAIGRMPTEERERVVRQVFATLPAERQWELLAGSFDDPVIDAFLTARQAISVEATRQQARIRTLATEARAHGRLDLAAMPSGIEVTLGLFRERDVRAAVIRGYKSESTARRLILRTTDQPGRLHVIEDVFNPTKGYFVSASYDEEAWASERLLSHGVVRIGSILERSSLPEFEPVVYPGAHVDTETADEAAVGRLHLGFAVLGANDVFGG